jgi:hypothetical protein
MAGKRHHTLRFAVVLLAIFSCAAGAGPASAEQFMLRDNVLLGTSTGRQLLQYLVSCALRQGDTIRYEEQGNERVLAGSLGLAPEWPLRALTESEERQISGCILARTNFFGVPVSLSVRNEAAEAAESLSVDAAERRTFTYFEGGFFGNIFKAQKETYICTGNSAPHRESYLRSLLRVCTLAEKPGDQGRLSRCGFEIAGDCQSRPFTQKGVDYSRDVMRVYLPAGHGMDAGNAEAHPANTTK